MAQTKIYPATKQQAENIQDTVDEINSKVGGQLQVKTVMPSNVQQTVQADAGYTALSGVVVNPIAALMPESVEDYILRNNQGIYFTLNLNGAIPDYACYKQEFLTAVYGNITSIGESAFNGCISLKNGNFQNATSINASAFTKCTSLERLDIRNVTSINGALAKESSIQSIDARNLTQINNYVFANISNLFFIDLRNANSFGIYVFDRDQSLRLMDLTNKDVPPTLLTNTFPNANVSQLLFVVKNDNVKTNFQSATNWSAIADQIYTVAEIETLYGDTYDNLYLQWFGHPRFDESEGE